MMRNDFGALQNDFLRLQNHFITLHYDFFAVQHDFPTLHYHFLPLQNHFLPLQHDSPALQHDFPTLHYHFLALQHDFPMLHFDFLVSSTIFIYCTIIFHGCQKILWHYGTTIFCSDARATRRACGARAHLRWPGLASAYVGYSPVHDVGSLKLRPARTAQHARGPLNRNLGCPT